ncbi:hypothetical protein PoB_001960700 [Plakobranchus ocellatus]|uniref:Uncharacterized protein n=1 Tax=Plakobranchus ocellatus TaxID=259542 RepID=A0AAV3ZF44_9GAST|nr:hypothetical protein PoB_001960700 [Plakobranchus ocellatus]
MADREEVISIDRLKSAHINLIQSVTVKQPLTTKNISVMMGDREEVISIDRLKSAHINLIQSVTVKQPLTTKNIPGDDG